MDPLPAPLRPSGPDRVVVHTSLRGLLASIATPLVLVALGAAALSRDGGVVFPTILVVAGIGIGAVALLDMPRRVELDLTGITRVCWLRRQRIGWDQVAAIERTRPSTATHARNLLDRRSAHRGGPVISGGLVARGRGRRRWLLTDRVESRDEHDRVAALLERVATPVMLRAPKPHEGAPPTDLYRRRRG